MVGAVYVEEVLFASLALTIRDYPYFPSWSTWYLNLEYMISGFEDPVALHCIAPHFMAFGVILRTYDCDRTGTTSFIGHNDAASYLVGYEGRSSYASMCIKHNWFGIMLQLHALMVWIQEFQCIDLLFFKKMVECWMWSYLCKHICYALMLTHTMVLLMEFLKYHMSASCIPLLYYVDI